jgi:hypothetical protein
MCVVQASTNSGQGAISYWLPVGRKPGKFIGALWTTWSVLRHPPYHCELYPIELKWVPIKAPLRELRMSLGCPCPSSVFNYYPHTSWTEYINVLNKRLTVDDFKNCCRWQKSKEINRMERESTHRRCYDKVYMSWKFMKQKQFSGTCVGAFLLCVVTNFFVSFYTNGCTVVHTQRRKP